MAYSCTENDNIELENIFLPMNGIDPDNIISVINFYLHMILSLLDSVKDFGKPNK